MLVPLVLKQAELSKVPELDPDQWVDRYSTVMFRYTLIRVKDPDTAEEILQTTLFSALQACDSFQGRSSEKSWLFGILKHKILDHFRKQKHRLTYELNEYNNSQDENSFDSEGHWLEAPANWAFDPEKHVENSELLKALSGCMDCLPEKLRTVFVLKEVEGYSSKEICRLFNISQNNLWVILHRARKQLQRCLESQTH